MLWPPDGLGWSVYVKSWAPQETGGRQPNRARMIWRARTLSASHIAVFILDIALSDVVIAASCTECLVKARASPYVG